MFSLFYSRLLQFWAHIVWWLKISRILWIFWNIFALNFVDLKSTNLRRKLLIFTYRKDGEMPGAVGCSNMWNHPVPHHWATWTVSYPDVKSGSHVGNGGGEGSLVRFIVYRRTNCGEQLRKSVIQIPPITAQIQTGSLLHVYSFLQWSPPINIASATWVIPFQGMQFILPHSLPPWESFLVCSLLINSVLIRVRQLQIGPTAQMSAHQSAGRLMNLLYRLCRDGALAKKYEVSGPSLILGEKWANIIDLFHYTKTTNN